MKSKAEKVLRIMMSGQDIKLPGTDFTITIEQLEDEKGNIVPHVVYSHFDKSTTTTIIGCDISLSSFIKMAEKIDDDEIMLGLAGIVVKEHNKRN